MKYQIPFLFYIIAIIAISYSIIAPLYPYIATSKKVNQTTIGIVFTFYALSNILVIPITNNLIDFFGRRRLCKMALFICSISTISFGLIDSLKSRRTFIIISCIVMFFEGIGVAILSIMLYSIAASLSDNEDINTNIGYLELAYSVGLSIGPLIASGLFFLCGVRFPFYFCGSTILLVGNYLLHKVAITDEQNTKTPNFFKLFLNLEVLLSFLVIMCDMISTSFIFPVFITHLETKFGLRVEIASLFFALEIIGYFLALQVLNPINIKLGNKLTMVLGLFINIFAVLFLCPINLIPQNWTMVLFGMTIIGFGGVLITVPGLIDIMGILKDKMNLGEQKANDNASAIYNFASALGEAFGPLIGGFLTERKGFETACYSISLLNFVFCILFSLVNVQIIKKEFGEAKQRYEIYEGSLLNHTWSNKLDASFYSVGDKRVSFGYKKYIVSISQSHINTPRLEGYNLIEQQI